MHSIHKTKRHSNRNIPNPIDSVFFTRPNLAARIKPRSSFASFFFLGGMIDLFQITNFDVDVAATTIVPVSGCLFGRGQIRKKIFQCTTEDLFLLSRVNIWYENKIMNVNRSDNKINLNVI